MLNIINSTVIGKADSGGGRLFSFALSNEAVEKYKGIKEASKTFRRLQTEYNKGGQSKLDVQESTLKDFQKERTLNMNDIVKSVQRIVNPKVKAIESVGSRIQRGSKDEDIEENYKKNIKVQMNYTSDTTFTAKDSDNNPITRVNFFFLGDLIDAALTIIHERPKTSENKCGPNISGKNNPNEKEMYEEARVMLGTIAIQDRKSGEIIERSLADIPISLETFKDFWYEEVYARRLPSYSLRQFLAQVCTKLVSNSLSNSIYGSSNLISANTVKLVTLQVNEDGILDKIWTDKKLRKRISTQQIKEREMSAPKDSAGDTNKTGKGSSKKEFLFLYSRGTQPYNSEEKSTLAFNRENAIPHLFAGNTVGPVKKINFKRKNVPGILEASIDRNKEGARSQFLNADRYDAGISMFGNPFYKPGMAIYIDPRSLGLGRSVAESRKGEENNWALSLGLGGYYNVIGVSNVIRPGFYETTLDALNQVGLGALAPMRKSEKKTGNTNPAEQSIERKPGNQR